MVERFESGALNTDQLTKSHYVWIYYSKLNHVLEDFKKRKIQRQELHSLVNPYFTIKLFFLYFVIFIDYFLIRQMHKKQTLI